MATAISMVERALRGRGWRFQQPTNYAIVTGVRSLGGRQYVIGIFDQAAMGTMVFLFVPLVGGTSSGDRRLRLHPQVGHTEDQIAGSLKILLHFNYIFQLGSFGVNQSDGEVRFRVDLHYRDVLPSQQQINGCIDTAVINLDGFLPRLEGFLNGTISLEEALGTGEAPGSGMRL